MRIVATVTLTALSTLSLSQPSLGGFDSNQSISAGAGMLECSHAVRLLRRDTVKRAITAWAQGYTTGLNMNTDEPKNLMPISLNYMPVAVMDYCAKRPGDLVINAVNDIYGRLEAVD